MRCHLVGCGTAAEPPAIGYAMHYSRSHDAVIRIYDDAGKFDRKARRSQLEPDYSSSTVKIDSEKIRSPIPRARE
jgi:hypothetical protein